MTAEKRTRMSEDGLIMLTADDGSEEAFFVLEKADIAGISLSVL